MVKKESSHKVVPFNPQALPTDPVLPTLSSMRAHLERLYNISQHTSMAGGVNFINGAHMGIGKTVALETAPKPVLVDSFDPGGTDSIQRELLASGAVVVNRIFENEFIHEPRAYRLWFNNFNYLRKHSVFDNIGTYSIDSGTMFSEAALNYAMATAGRPAQIPQLQDYLAQLLILQAMFKYVCSLPCHVVVNFHLENVTDDNGRLVGKEYLITGKGAIRIPILFSEVYSTILVTTPVNTVERRFVTQPWSHYQARTRMGREAGFAVQEVADYAALLKRAGKNWQDKPLLSGAVAEVVNEATKGEAV